MEMLVVPEFVSADGAVRPRSLDFRLSDVPALDLSTLLPKPYGRPAGAANVQTAEVLSAEQNILNSGESVRWIRPSDADPDIVQYRATPAVAWDQPVEQMAVTGAGSSRGIVLHAIMEELLTGALPEDSPAVEKRAAELSRRLDFDADAGELASTALRTAALPELASGRDAIVTEVPIYGQIGAGAALRYIAGRADAVRYRDGQAETVFDWKSDVAPRPVDREAYARQLAQYAHVLGAARGAVVYMSTGEIQWVEAQPGAPPL